MAFEQSPSYEGGCTCGAVRYRMTSAPMIVHCCHCRWCQRESGASFALNAMIESDRVVLLQGEIEFVYTPSQSGKGQKIARCPKCHVAVWSHYAGGGDAVCFVRVGTLISSRRLNNPGSYCQRAHLRLRRITRLPFIGRRRASLDVQRYRPESRPGQAARN
jgi:hypothetical protein